MHYRMPGFREFLTQHLPPEDFVSNSQTKIALLVDTSIIRTLRGRILSEIVQCFFQGNYIVIAYLHSWAFVSIPSFHHR